jgi:5-methylcytosine-specific restriction endonuclease McrA
MTSKEGPSGLFLYIYFMKLSKTEYNELLLSHKWLAKRAKVFKRDGYKCQRCGVNKNLNCHHKYYLFKKKPWEYPLSSLLTLCKECHTNLHCESKIPTKVCNKTSVKNKTQKRIETLYNSLSEKDRSIQKRYNALQG